MTVFDRSLPLVLVFASVACGGTASGGAGAGGSSGSSGSAGSAASSGSGGATGGGGGSGGSGGSGGIDCSTVGCGAPPLCSEGCGAPCGCCGCALGSVQNLGGIDYVCQGDCWAPQPDGGMSCDVTADCPTGFFCRPLQSGGSACAAFAGDGDPCGGYTPVWAEMICAPDLVCVDLPPLVVDAPGVCRMPCAADAECPTDRYCAASSDVCRDDGACWDDLDCEQVGNSYVRPKCLGYGVCTAGSCSYECGDGACRDLANVFFGACEKVLGWAVVSGACLPVSGCDARGFTFFATASACSTQCGK